MRGLRRTPRALGGTRSDSRGGLRRVCRRIDARLSHALETLRWYIHRLDEWLFMSFHSMDFSGFIPRKDLTAESAFSLLNSHNFSSYSGFLLGHLLDEALETGVRFQNFIDIGCGKGQQCIFVARHYKFDGVYGVDFSEPLIQIAKRNVSKTSYKNINLSIADAVDWKIPDGNCIVFLFNPFNQIILEKFVRTNLRHFARFQSLIAYGMDEHRATIQNLGFEILFRSHRYEHSLLRLNEEIARATT
jgi:SAM-dependent methyltransferase